LGVVDIDPEVLRSGSIWAQHAAKQAHLHTLSEYPANTPDIMETLVSEGPYAYMISPYVRDGSVTLPVMTTREEVAKGYDENWAMLRMMDFRPIVELRGAWYLFSEALTHIRMHSDGQEHFGQCVALLTATNVEVPGITGELCWGRKSRAELGRDRPAKAPEAVNEGKLRRELFVQHDRYLDLLRAADVEGMLALMDEGIQSSVRNYVEDTGALVLLDSIDAHRDNFRAFFEKYEVQSVGLLDRITQEWYLFAEIRLTVRERGGAGRTLAFHTAEIFVPAHDGKFIARIGHGTDPV
jgi:hypothetical protein